MSKEKQLKVYSFLCDKPYQEYEHVIAFDLRQCKKAAREQLGEEILRYLPGGDQFSSSDFGVSDVKRGMVVQ
jgi:hypothetical protein